MKLPSASQMWEDIRFKEAEMAKRYVKSQRHTIQVDYIKFMDELAELNGCKPNFGETLTECLNELIFEILFDENDSECRTASVQI